MNSVVVTMTQHPGNTYIIDFTMIHAVLQRFSIQLLQISLIFSRACRFYNESASRHYMYHWFHSELYCFYNELASRQYTYVIDFTMNCIFLQWISIQAIHMSLILLWIALVLQWVSIQAIHISLTFAMGCVAFTMNQFLIWILSYQHTVAYTPAVTIVSNCRHVGLSSTL